MQNAEEAVRCWSGADPVVIRGRSDVDRVSLCRRGTCNINYLALNFLAYLLATRRIDGAGTGSARRVPDVSRVTSWHCWTCDINTGLRHS